MPYPTPAKNIEGYVYYFSTLYGCWMVISPVSGFHPRMGSEQLVLSLISRELRKPMGMEYGPQTSERQNTGS